MAKMQDSNVSKPGLWRIGVLLEASFQEQLKESPMKVIKSVADKSDNSCLAIALCKQSLLSTYEYINEYMRPPNKMGCLIGAVDESKCKYPSVIVSPISKESIDFDELYAQIQITPNELEMSTGLPHPSIPNVLLVSQHFMQSYGFFTKEPVWYRYLTPVPLERVILTPCGPSDHLAMTFAELVVGQMYQKCKREHIIMQQDFEYVFRVTLPLNATSTQTIGCEPLQQATPISTAMQDRVLTFKVLETSPVLQGLITEETTIVLLSPDEQDVGEEWSLRDDSRLRRRRSTREEALEKGRAESAASASDFLFEEHQDSDNFISGLPYTEHNDYIIEGVAIGNYKLQSHYIVLPKDSAVAHGVFHLQKVWVCTTTLNPGPQVTKLEDFTLSLVNEQRRGGSGESPRMHLAVVFTYEDEFELEKYVPPSQLGIEYEAVDLTRAYIHPELLFHLYPETLSYSRKYQLHIKHCKENIPYLREVRVVEVYQPGQHTVSSVSLLQRSLRNQSLFLSAGDVLSVKTDTGKQYFKVTSLEPNVNNASCVDPSENWDCILLSHKVSSYIPDLVPPSLIDRPLFFSDIQPPGLEEFCNTLFSFFIPAFREKSSTRPRRSPSVLMSGPPGVGKRTIIKAVARRCRMNVVELNCFEFSSEVVGFAEKKITVELDTASSNAPVVIVLRHIHMMGMRDHTHQEPRLLAMFENYMAQVDQFNRTNQYPILVVGVSSYPGTIPARVQACFLHQLDVTTPTQAQRLAMLNSLARGYHVSPEVTDVQVLSDLSKRTAGFTLGDLLQLYSHAYELAHQDVVKHCLSSNGHSHSEDLSISGVVVSADHIERSLSCLHSSHSDAIGAPKIPNVKWEDVGGLGDAKREILDTIQLPLQHPELFSSGVQRSGVLLYGPPGTGKTLLAKAVATECSLNFLSVKGPELINMYVGQSEENIREVFSRASSAAPCVIFFDELDSIAPNRGRSGDSGGVMDRVVSQLLAELDGLNKSEHVFVIGASNRPDLIDPGLLRPGRFDRMVYLGISEDTDSKVKILNAITRKFNLSPDVDLDVLAAKCPLNLTGADLYALCSDAMLTALRKQIAVLDKNHKTDEEWEGELTITQEDFLESMENLSPSVPAEELERYKEIKKNLKS